MLFRFCSVLVVLVLAALAQASLGSYPSEEEKVTRLDRLYLEHELKHGEQLLREILAKPSHLQLQDLERLSEPLRSKRCRWKLCGTGRKFRYL